MCLYLEALRQHLPGITEGGSLASVLEHCMYCGMSLARVGLDMRGLLPPIFEACVLTLFTKVICLEGCSSGLSGHHNYLVMTAVEGELVLWFLWGLYHYYIAFLPGLSVPSSLLQLCNCSELFVMFGLVFEKQSKMFCVFLCSFFAHPAVLLQSQHVIG